MLAYVVLLLSFAKLKVTAQLVLLEAAAFNSLLK